MADMTGRTLGKYRLIERLGRGGMAEVYRAYQPRLERDVAVKVMLGYLAEDEKFVGRFEREAKAVAALHHPHIVQIYDSDVEDDVYYMVMEYIGGETLKARLKRLNAERKRMSLDDVARIFRALCDALDYAHAQGCIHRDIKPANVMFDGERLVLTDFGIASIVGGTRYTASGAMVGTPAYMSPEQGQGDPGDVRSDVYSLGIILYEMVTGRLPYDADTPLAIVLKHLNEPLPPPSQVRADVPLTVERVILKALAKSPDDRYQSAGALAEALEAAVESAEVPAEALPPLREPRVAAAPPAPVAEPAPPRRQMLWALVGVAALAVVALAVAALLILPDRGGEAEPTVSPTKAASSTDAVAHYEAGVVAFHEEGDYETALREFTQAIEADPEFAEAYYQRGIVYAEDDQPIAAEADLSQAIALQPDLVEAYYERGYLYLYDLDRAEDALADYTAAIELNSEFVEAYVDRARCYLWYGDDHEQALADLDHALELDPDLAEAWGLRGEVYFWREEYDLARPGLTRAVELDPEDTWAWAMLGSSHYWMGEYEEAIASYDEALQLEPGELDLYYHRAFASFEMGNLDAVLEDLNKVLLLEPEHSGAYYGRGRLHAAAGRYEEAIADFTEVMKDKEQEYEWPYFPEDSPYLDRALAYQALGRTEEALADLDMLIEEAPYWHLPYYYRGLIYKELGQTEAASADFRALWENAPDEEWQRKAEGELEALQ
ncbi:MAG: serine/threonine-protein kinase [Anaerolineales bacterium]|nr:MAG: serine/threonine-protein kinase [Anaerolineales bacterium]